MVIHFGPNGPGDCNAQPGNCPFGNVPHFDTMEEAREVYERSMEQQGYGFSTLKANRGKVYSTFEEAHAAFEHFMETQGAEQAIKRTPFTLEEMKSALKQQLHSVNERMEAKYGASWAPLLEQRAHPAYDDWRAYSAQAEEYERQLVGYRFALSEDEPTVESLELEKMRIEEFLVEEHGELDPDWAERADEYKFANEVMPYYERIEAIDRKLKSLES